MTYNELSLNDRIHLKGVYETFVHIAQERWLKSMERKIYSKGKIRFNKNKTGNDRWSNPHTRNLEKSLWGRASMKESGDSIKFEFAMYGRFVDAGVGRGTGQNLALYRKKYGAARSGIKRQPKRWYSKTKSHEEKRLAEILALYNVKGMIGLVETALNNTYITVQ